MQSVNDQTYLTRAEISASRLERELGLLTAGNVWGMYGTAFPKFAAQQCLRAIVLWARYRILRRILANDTRFMVTNHHYENIRGVVTRRLTAAGVTGYSQILLGLTIDQEYLIHKIVELWVGYENPKSFADLQGYAKQRSQTLQAKMQRWDKSRLTTKTADDVIQEVMKT